MKIDDLVIARVNDAEFESAKVADPGHHRVLTEENVGDRPGETRKYQPRNHRQTQQTDDGLQRDQDVGCQPHGHGTSVAYGRRSVNAEEEGLQKRSVDSGIEGVDQAVRSASVVEQSETAIERKVDDGNEEKEAAPGGADQVGVGQKCMQPPASSLHIKAAVAIEQAKLTLRRDDSAEPQVAGWIVGSLGVVFASALARSPEYFLRAPIYGEAAPTPYSDRAPPALDHSGSPHRA